MKLDVLSMTKGMKTIFQRRMMQRIKLLMRNILTVKFSLIHPVIMSLSIQNKKSAILKELLVLVLILIIEKKLSTLDLPYCGSKLL